MSTPTPSDIYSQLLSRMGEAQPRPRLEPVQRLTDLLGQPQTLYPVILVGGTNGKTSTARAIESLLRAYGLKTGLFTSPHLVSFTERIQIDGENISEDFLAEVWNELQPALEIVDVELRDQGEPAITFFEALAALAYSAFADAPVEVAVVEVGMGGEWDATNIIDAEVAVMTPIGLDHVHILGETTTEIARTKSHILKAGKTLVSASQETDVLRVLQEHADTVGATIHAQGKDFVLRSDQGGVGGRIIEVTGITGHEYEGAFIPLFGPHQAENMTLAVAAVEAFLNLGTALPTDVLEQGLGQVTSPGRLQPIGIQPLVLVDAAHNPHGAHTLATAMEESFSFEELIVIAGMLDDKDSRGVLEELLSITPNLYLTGIHSDRAMSPDDLAFIAREIRADVNMQVFDELEEAVYEARGWAEEADGRGVLITGSIVLVGEAISLARNAEWGHEA